MDINNLEWNSEFNSYADISTGQLYSIAEVAYATSQQGTAPVEVTSAWDWSGLTKGAQDLVTAYNSFQLQQINLQRAQKGLPALNPSVYAPQVGLNLSAGTMNIIMWSAIGLGAVLLLKRR